MTMYKDILLEKAVRKIIDNRDKILNDFTEAYLSENMKNVPIKDLVLNEQSLSPHGSGFKYWFTVGDHNEKQPYHCCERDDFTCHFLSRKLTLTYQKEFTDSVHTIVKICPFCGYKPDE